MDNQAALINRSIVLADSIRRFAERRGWRPDDYLLAVQIEPGWNLISFSLASDEFATSPRGKVEDSESIALLRHLRADLADVQGLFESLGCSLHRASDPDALAAMLYPMLGEGWIAVDLGLVNPGRKLPRVVPVERAIS